MTKYKEEPNSTSTDQKYNQCGTNSRLDTEKGNIADPEDRERQFVQTKGTEILKVDTLKTK